jgi:hypothetical protein
VAKGQLRSRCLGRAARSQKSYGLYYAQLVGERGEPLSEVCAVDTLAPDLRCSDAERVVELSFGTP